PRGSVSRHAMGSACERGRARVAAIAVATAASARRRVEAYLPDLIRNTGSSTTRTTRRAAAIPAAVVEGRPHPPLQALGEERPGRPYPRVRSVRQCWPPGPAAHGLARRRNVARRLRSFFQTTRQPILSRPSGGLGPCGVIRRDGRFASWTRRLG